MKIVIRFFSEITLKSPSMRKHLIDILRRNIQKTVSTITPDFRVTGGWDQLRLELPDDELVWRQTAEALASVSGIEYFFRVQEEDFTDFESTLRSVLRVAGPLLPGKTFCARVRRVGDHDFRSMDLERFLGEGILRQIPDCRVRLEEPDITVSLEVRRDKLLIPLEKIRGIGGMPVGSEGKVLVLISGGYDSSVAAQMMMNRGCRVDYLFFNLGGYSHRAGVLQNVHYLWQRFSSTYAAKIHIVPFETIIAGLIRQTDHRYRGVLLKRMMFRAADIIAKKNGYRAIVTGECMAQVSSQTLTNLPIITEAAETLVMRPLLAMNKPEIITRARQIGTAVFAEKMPEYCGAVSDKPTAGAKRSAVLVEEAKLDQHLLAGSMRQAETLSVHDIPNTGFAKPKIETATSASVQDVVIDIREPAEREELPLQTSARTIDVPFYELEQALKSLDPKQSYLLYCERGVLSKAHAEAMLNSGFHDVRVFRPV